jgi:hypothetical protein
MTEKVNYWKGDIWRRWKYYWVNPQL